MHLTILHLGPWAPQMKCPTCMERYERLYAVDDAGLRMVPWGILPSSERRLDGTGTILWNSNFNLDSLGSLLQEAMAKGAVSRAEVLLCVAAMWLCALMRKIDARPMLMLDIAGGEGAPPGIRNKPHDLSRYHEETIVPHMLDWYESGALLQTLWVRADPLWAYGRGLESPTLRVPRYARGFFFPFVALPSLHITDRYVGCHGDRGEVLVMRETGWPGSFASSMRGQMFYATLRQFVQRSSALRLRMLPYSEEVLTYRMLARHRMAVWIPLAPCCKLTFNDLVAMEMPLWMPSLELQASISARWQCRHHLEIAGDVLLKRTMLDRCQFEELDRWLPLSHFLRHPHVQRFGSTADLAAQLATASCDSLEAIRARMARWQRELARDDAAFWRLAVAALRAAPAQASRSLRPAFRLPRIPDGQLCTARPGVELAEAAHCNLQFMDEVWRERCCEAVAQLLEWTPETDAARAIAMNPSSTGPRSSPCLWKPSSCSPDVIRFGTHLLQDAAGAS